MTRGKASLSARVSMRSIIGRRAAHRVVLRDGKAQGAVVVSQVKQRAAVINQIGGESG